MNDWQLQEAKTKFDVLFKLCQEEGPQEISVEGKAEAVFISKKDYDKFVNPKPNFVEFMRASPLYGLDIKFERSKELSREIDL